MAPLSSRAAAACGQSRPCPAVAARGSARHPDTGMVPVASAAPGRKNMDRKQGKRIMRTLLLATAAVAMVGFAGTARAETVDLEMQDMETITAGNYMPGFNFDYTKYGYVDVFKNFNINARLDVYPKIIGNFADAEAVANAFGDDTYSETLTFADVVKGQMSRSGSSSIAATRGSYYGGYHDGYKRGY